MRVLVCSAARFGIANVVYNVIEKMEPHDVEITYCRNPLNPSPDWCETVDVLDEDRYERISSFLPESFLYRPVHLLYGILWYWRKAFKYIERHSDEYDVFWLHSPHPVIFDRYSGDAEPLVVTIHSRPLQYQDRDGIDALYYQFLHRRQTAALREPHVNQVTGVGPDIVSELRQAGITDSKLEFVQNGVDIDKYSPGETTTSPLADFDISPDHTVLLYLSRFTEPKRPKELLRLFTKVKQRKDDVSLVMAGEGELLPDSKDFVRNLELKDVYFLGYVSGAEKIDLYRNADIFVLSSKYEGGYPPLVLAEAMAIGLPCVISRIEAANIVQDANCGISIDFTSYGQSPEKMVSYIEAYPRDHGLNARNYTVENFSWQSISKSYLDLFYKL